MCINSTEVAETQALSHIFEMAETKAVSPQNPTGRVATTEMVRFLRQFWD